VWAVFGVVDTEPHLRFFPTRVAAADYMKDVRNCGASEMLAVLEVRGVDYSAVSFGEVFTLGWVQDLVQA
jgi:hypothetical protein